MGVLVQLIATYAPYVYAACGLVALYQLYRLWQVRVDRRQAVFSLERSRAMRVLYGIFTVALFLLLVLGITYFLSRTATNAIEMAPAAEPTLPAEFSLQIVPTNTPIFVTPSPTPTATTTPTPLPATPEPGVTPSPATTLPATPTPPPAAPVVAAPPACGDPRAVITAPGNGQTVSGVFTILGTATHDRFSYYKVEFAPGAGASSGFTYLADGRGPVFSGALASVNTSGLDNGPWTFQLTVVDQTGNFIDPPCRLTVVVQN